MERCFMSLSLCVLFRLCGRGRTAGAGGVSTVLSEAVEIGEVISGALGVWHLEEESRFGLLLSGC
jgi:hypothetical protein